MMNFECFGYLVKAPKEFIEEVQKKIETEEDFNIEWSAFETGKKFYNHNMTKCYLATFDHVLKSVSLVEVDKNCSEGYF